MTRTPGLPDGWMWSKSYEALGLHFIAACPRHGRFSPVIGEGCTVEDAKAQAEDLAWKQAGSPFGGADA